MRITVNRNELGNAFAWATKGIATRPVTPVLEGIVVSVDGETLTLSQFDYERASRAWLNGTNAEAGDILVSAPSLKKVIAALPKGTRVTAGLTADGDTLSVECGDITWKLPSLPRGEYPQLPTVPELAGVIDGAAFARSVARVADAAGRDDTLPILTGVCLTPADGALTLAATDRYRLAVDPISWTRAGSASGRYIIPARPLAEFAAKVDKSGKVSVFLSDDFAAFRDDSRELIIRPITGEFIRYESRVDFDSPVKVTVSAPALADVIKRVTPSVERGYPLLLNVTLDGITVSSVSGDVNVAAKPVAAVSDGPITVGFSPQYLLPLLEGFDGEIRIGLAERKPALLSEDASGYRAIVVPQRLVN